MASACTGVRRVDLAAGRRSASKMAKPSSPSARRSMAAGVWISISRCFASSCVDEVRMTRITSSMLA